MRVLFYISHPAQFHFSKLTIEELKRKNHEVDILVKTKDVLIQLLDERGWEYTNIQTKERKRTRLSICMGLIKRNLVLFKFCFGKKIDVMVGTDASIAHVGFLLRIPVVTVLEDDYKVIKTLARLTYPFTNYILTPKVCKVGKWEEKKIGYDGYMKLAYLHPFRFIPSSKYVQQSNKEPYFLIRLSSLCAHHDFGKKGITEKYLDILIEKLSSYGRIYISSEKQLPSKFQKYILTIPTSQLHNYVYYAELLISDSQSMSVEAAMLGTPSIRISSFSGKISVLEELEYKYNLTHGYLPDNISEVMNKVKQLLLMSDRKTEYRRRRDKILSEKIDVTGFLVWFIERFPQSVKTLAQYPEIQQQFIISRAVKEKSTYAKQRNRRVSLISDLK